MTTALDTRTPEQTGKRKTDPFRPITAPRPRALTVSDLSAMTPDQADQVFRQGEIAQLPDGQAEGVALFRPGSALQPKLAAVVRSLFWQGKLFDARTKTLKNIILPIQIPAISADVYKEPSWFDNQPCIVLDYSKRSILARYIRDEIRRVGPGLYLGLVYWGHTRLMYFTLQFPV
ncbi:MAG TPA: hypothetical protein VN764_00440 [Polyangiaceae bacterium]|nr:hypothetical protein [Polyangiaceae bacterium]